MHTTTAIFETTTAEYSQLVDRIQKRNPAALEELYGLVKNFTYFLMRQLGTQDLQDNVHDVYVTVAQAIAAGKLRDPERLSAFLTTVARFYSYSQIERRVQSRARLLPLDGTDVPDDTDLELKVYRKQRVTFVRDILRQMPALDREILLRFYIEEQSKEQICQEMKITPTQFRNMKSQAKLALTRLGARRLKKGVLEQMQRPKAPNFGGLEPAFQAA